MQSAASLDKALAHIAGILYPRIPLQRISVSMRVGEDLVIVGLWTTHPTRLVKGTRLRLAASVFPELARAHVVPSSQSNLAVGTVLQDEGITEWVAVGIPHPDEVQGILTFGSTRDVFGGTDVFQTVGLAIGPQLHVLAGATSTFTQAVDSLRRKSADP